MNTIISTEEIKKVYGTKGITSSALDGVDLKVKEGEFLGIMGPSGSGKTTLLNILSTIDIPTSGKVLYRGNEYGKMSKSEQARFRRENVGFIFQDFNLLDNMTVEDNIALPLALSGKPYNEITAKVLDLSSFFGLEPHLKKYPYQLSGGQKQRAAAARAIITTPSVIFADEPTGALDSKSSTELLQCLTDINRKYGATIVMVTHDSFAASYCKRILFLKDGKIHAKLEQGNSRKELFHRILDLLSSMGGETSELF